MHLDRLLATLAFLFFAAVLSAQVVVKGELRLGDTTQVHVLQTKDGNRLTGRIIGFEEEQLTFLFKNQTKLVFLFSEIEYVEIQDGTLPPASPGLPAGEETLSPVPFTYAAILTGGASDIGVLTSANDTGFRYARESGTGTRFIAWNKAAMLRHIGPSPVGRTTERHLLNTYRGDRFMGYLLDFQNGALRFIIENGDTLQFSITQIRRIQLEDVSTVDPISLKPTVVEDDMPMQASERLYFSPSAFMLKEGKGEFRSFVLYNSIDYGLGDNFTIGAGGATVFVATLANMKMKFGGSLGKYVHVALGGSAIGAFVGRQTLK